ncbi:hypothetical protein M9H77_35613 [Catharanthus roseus]|uniref:Uncharacterized protein n=1 Tax=Catharanthus roseus TaxID=4058 RepID=A0ACB9ZPU5_CATRO|nr:hypothetical protein M9H77_35613 [Catharanthus roseus]
MQQGVSGLNQEQLTEQHLGQFGGSSMQENSCAARLPSGLIQVNKTAISEGLIAEETMQKQQQAASNQAEFGGQNGQTSLQQNIATEGQTSGLIQTSGQKLVVQQAVSQTAAQEILGAEGEDTGQKQRASGSNSGSPFTTADGSDSGLI